MGLIEITTRHLAFSFALRHFKMEKVLWVVHQVAASSEGRKIIMVIYRASSSSHYIIMPIIYYYFFIIIIRELASLFITDDIYLL